MASPCSVGLKRGAENELTPNDSAKRYRASKESPTTAALISKDSDLASFTSSSSIQVNHKDSGVPCSDDTQQQRSQPEYLSQPTSAGSFFSLPIELRNEIYRYLRPKRIHIAPPFDVQEDHHTKPWALIAVCREWRDESRAVAYPETPIDIYLSELSETTAYETWINGLHEGLEASIRHIGIDEFVYIDWIHDGPMPERPKERRKRLEIQSLMDIERKHGVEELYEWDFDHDDYVGDWKLRWLQRKNGNHGSREETVSDMLDVMEERITKSNTPMGGFGKDGIRKLVASYPASQFDPNACEQYDGEYGEDFGAEYAGDYGEGYGNEYGSDSEEHGREDFEEGHEQEHEKEADGSSKEKW
ncbi:MAG: hypothetical protein Q9204_005626 [Flavoplaca sp. TL-2023a]